MYKNEMILLHLSNHQGIFFSVKIHGMLCSIYSLDCKPNVLSKSSRGFSLQLPLCVYL